MINWDRVRDRLEAIHTHIKAKWTTGEYFAWDSADENAVPQVCLAGGVLYSMNYTDEENLDKNTVVEVMYPIYEAIPAGSKAKKNNLEALTNCREIRHAYPFSQNGKYDRVGPKEWDLCKHCYSDGVIATVTEWNDSHRKPEILKVIDKSIKRSIQEMERV